MSTLLTKYRPRTFDEVIGQDAIVRSLEQAIQNASAKTFLFMGPSGCGKTTLARIVSTRVGCDPANVIEIDAATHTGIDAMREIADMARYRAIGKSGTKAVIIDEAHRLSRQAWDSLLKILEEPPAHVYWFLCTTEPDKVPNTIGTRALSYTLSLVDEDDLYDLLQHVVEQENMDVDDSILDLIASRAQGSPRQALAYLAVCAGAESRKEAAQLIRVATDEGEAVELARMLVKRKGLTWAAVQKLLKALQNEQPESIRLVVVNYVQKVLLNCKEKEAPYLLSILDAFSHPCNASEKMAPILLAVGSIMYEEG